jgi:hypothetical protein
MALIQDPREHTTTPPERFSSWTRMIELYISIINVYIIIDYMIIIDVSRSRLWRIVEREK